MEITHTKRWLVVPLVAAAMAVLPMTVAADKGDGGGPHGHGDSQDFGLFASASPDSGTCGNDWANDTFKRNFTVQKNSDGTFAVREAFNGHFLTIASRSPGACETSSPRGHIVKAGVKGKFGGFLSGTVRGGTTFNEDGCDTAGACNTTTGFVKAVFGPTAMYSCLSGIGSCSFFFNYTALDQALILRHWINASDDLGGNRGDIASS